MSTDENDFHLQFHEPLGEHVLSDDIRKAFIWASIQKFLNEEQQSSVDKDFFSESNKVLSKAVIFYGPFYNFEEAEIHAQDRQGVVVSPEFMWTPRSHPVWIACLSN